VAMCLACLDMSVAGECRLGVEGASPRAFSRRSNALRAAFRESRTGGASSRITRPRGDFVGTTAWQPVARDGSYWQELAGKTELHSCDQGA
jgi:hypothetical protein